MNHREFTDNEIEEIKKNIEKYKNFYLPNNKKPFIHLFLTVLVYFIAMYLLTKTVYAIPLMILIMYRTFMIFHDCCHGSFFKVTEKEFEKGNKGLNPYIAEAIETMCIYPAAKWTKIHSHHHEVHGNLNKKDGTRTVITKEEYENLPQYKKILYRILRSPPIFFLLLPLDVFWIGHVTSFYWKYVIKYIIMMSCIYYYGGKKLATRFFISSWIAASFGTMAFHLQHQVNIGYWKRFDQKDKKTWERAQLHGASMQTVPWFLKWATFGIEYHHIHHITPRIPSYNLQKCHEDNEKLFNKITKIGYKQMFLSLFHTLYDEKNQRYISFPLAKKFGLEY